MSSTDRQAGQDFESIWAEIKLLLEWQQGFAFYLIFGDDQRITSDLRQRVKDAMLLRTGLLHLVRPETAEEAVDAVLKAALPEGAERRYDDWHAPLWIELTAGPGQPEWQAARRQTLAALNRRRSFLEQTCRRPVFLQLPEAMAPEVVMWAPDLWSIRQFVALLPARPASFPGVQDDPVRFREETIQISRNSDKAQETGRLDLALAASRKSVQRFQQLRASLGDTPQTLRDLSVSLNKLGDAEREAGNLAAAMTAFRDSLELSKQLRASLGDTPQTLRDLSVSFGCVLNLEKLLHLPHPAEDEAEFAQVKEKLATLTKNAEKN